MRVATGEQRAVARRVSEMGAGRLLTEKEAAAPDTLCKAIKSALADKTLRTAAEEMRSDLRNSGGAIAAADFVEEVFEKAK